MYIDIRSRGKYLLGHIENAININYYELLLNYDKYLNKNVSQKKSYVQIFTSFFNFNVFIAKSK